jgi:BlaI family penicillinase repressor|tara:strand:- start:68 stop:457 length:390 start_codon:yes stop_codon:yes gene_type:complete
MNSSKINISESEWAVMEVIWNADRTITSQEIITGLITDYSWSDGTIKTLINRLLKKGVIGFEKLDRRYLYYANLEKEKWVQEESKAFLKKIFQGKAMSMVAHFIKEKRFSAEELHDLEKLIAEARKRKK